MGLPVIKVGGKAMTFLILAKRTQGTNIAKSLLKAGIRTSGNLSFIAMNAAGKRIVSNLTAAARQIRRPGPRRHLRCCQLLN